MSKNQKPSTAHFGHVKRYQISQEKKQELQKGILRVIVAEQKYLDPDYSAARLAKELETNTRYLSMVLQTRFRCSYNVLVNRHRVEKAMEMLSNPAYAESTVAEIGALVGFSNRQSFYSAFEREQHITPRAYRMMNLPPHTVKAKSQKKTAASAADKASMADE